MTNNNMNPAVGAPATGGPQGPRGKAKRKVSKGPRAEETKTAAAAGSCVGPSGDSSSSSSSEKSASSSLLGGVNSSVLFSPVRVVGRVTCGVPFALSVHGLQAFVCCSIGRGFHVYEVNKLQQQLASPQLPVKVRCLYSEGERVFVGLKDKVVAFERLSPQCLYTGGHSLSVDGVLTVGPVLISHSKTEVAIWHKESAKLMHKLPLQGESHVTRLLHPETYLNKLLVARGGRLELWNFSTAQKLHEFRCMDSSQTPTPAPAGPLGTITALAQSTSPDVVAVGFSSGRVCVIDLKRDELLMEFQHSSAHGAVTALAFRTDAATAAAAASDAAAAAAAALVSGCASGALCIWSLSEGRLLETIPHAHADAVLHLQFLPSQPIMLSNGHDNALIEWIFDSPDGVPRELRARRGHVGIISQMEFYGAEGTELLTASALRGKAFVGRTSLIQQHQNCIYSQKNLKTKLPLVGVKTKKLREVTSLSAASCRHFDWPAVVTTHAGTHSVFVWSAHKKALEPKALHPPGIPPGAPHPPATVAACSRCGNFAVVGYADGRMHKYNLQSCLHRGQFKRGPSSSKRPQQQLHDELQQTAHKGPICGVAVLGSSLIVSASSDPEDCCLMVWELSSLAAKARVPLSVQGGGNGGGIRLFKTSGVLAAVLFRDGSVALVDILSCTIVRHISSVSPGIPLPAATCLAFSPDDRWLAAGCTDSSLWVYDILSASFIDWLQFKSPPVSITFDPTGSLLLTAHPHGQGGIFVWANKHIFDPTLGAPLLHKSPTKPLPMEDPVAVFDRSPGEETADAAAHAAADGGDAIAAALLRRYESTRQPLAAGAITLSGMPASHLHAIMHIDEIKAQSKPLKAPEPVADAPFFIPSRFEEGKTVLLPPEAVETPEGDKSKEAPRESFKERSRKFRSQLQRLLAAKVKSDEAKYEAVLEYLRGCSPTAIALALTDLGPTAGGDEEEILELLRFFRFQVIFRRNADLVQSLLSVFLKAHAEWLLQAPAESPAHELIQELHKLMQKDWGMLEEQFYQLECSLKFLAHLQME